MASPVVASAGGVDPFAGESRSWKMLTKQFKVELRVFSHISPILREVAIHRKTLRTFITVISY